MSSVPDAAGEIYDLGYRHYAGPRLGRRAAIGAIVVSGLRSLFGLGRSGRSKILPWGGVVLALLPAMVAVAVRVLVGDIVELYRYDNYLWGIGALFPIFLAAQAPELVIGDLRHRVLALYFSRPISRLDYVAAKLVALTLGLLTLTLVPVLVLFIGRVLAAEDVPAALGDELGALPAIVGSGILHAGVLALVGLAICSLAARRAFAAAAILAVFLVGGVVAGILEEVGDGLEAVAPFAYPLAVLDGTRQWLFGGAVADSPVTGAGVALGAYPVATVVLAGAAAAVLAVRYRTVPA